MPFADHAARVMSPSAFQHGTFRTINVGGSNSGITAITGKLSGKTTTAIRSYRFDPQKFTVAEAKKWLSGHDVKILGFEPAKKDNGR